MRHYVAVHMGVVQWSVVLHAMLHRTQPVQPLQLKRLDAEQNQMKNCMIFFYAFGFCILIAFFGF